VVVRVTVTPDGSVKNTAIAESSNNRDLDEAAVAGARNSTFLPKLVDCVPVTGDYLFHAQFVGSP
jgi:TonB family protein